jgi:GTP-dependent phosphoenolpyruvate carboxykinase
MTWVKREEFNREWTRIFANEERGKLEGFVLFCMLGGDQKDRVLFVHITNSDGELREQELAYRWS